MSVYPIIKGGLQSSFNYTWNDADLLGRGATAEVYLGRKKQNGDVVAVKQFRPTTHSGHGHEVEMRELELLQKLDHENVIKLFCVERQSISGGIVIIMEYCEGGSLHSLLDQPQYNYGLPEEDFLLVLKHVVNGIHYLQRLGIIHRDIKPGNIMRCFKENGSVCFKLTDFGAARELEEDENFTSMYGTEEYLYPAVYETAVLHLPTGQKFDGKVDLWSLGVTFYHSATGKLPFIPHGGRNNRETMFKIISQKESGVISGVQHFENGPIHWSRELPQTCLLSGGLRSILVPLLAGLMETNQYKMLNHDKLFEIVNNICGRTVFKVFHYAMCTQLSVYVDAKDSFSVLQDCIAEQTEIPANQQVLLIDGRSLEYEIDRTSPIETYPKFIKDGQLYVYNCTFSESHSLKLPDIPANPEFTMSYPDYERDCKTAFQSCARSHFIKKITEQILTQQTLMVEGEICLRSYIRSRSMMIEEVFVMVERILMESRKRFVIFYKYIETINDILSAVNHPSRELEELMKDRNLLSVHEKAEERKNEIAKYKSVFIEKLDDMRVNAASWVVACAQNSCLSTVKHYCENITTILGRFRRDKSAKGQMTSHDEKVHGFEREKLQKIYLKNVKILTDHCFSNVQMMFSQAMTYFATLVKAYSRIVKIERNVDSVTECQQLLSTRFDKIIDKADKLLSQVKLQSFKAADLGMSVSCVQATNIVSLGYGSGNPQQAVSITSPNDITQTITELKQDAIEMGSLVQTSTDILSRFFQHGSLLSNGSIGNLLPNKDLQK